MCGDSRCLKRSGSVQVYMREGEEMSCTRNNDIKTRKKSQNYKEQDNHGNAIMCREGRLNKAEEKGIKEVKREENKY